ncbi:hypothetical protein FEF65_07775 [Mariprofundus erugo]|uniref:GspL periplasmic domain-containing protein n=1 Tax=Mariprofundus erugo TaxID=2528639 RepID=A0A5R9GST3_9PROT|nr:GspL/Epsl periplasmic domain-containing protein [Mariprofundus erugo]TLS67317.1 hypothetical protein FEF65_07775 [Mariprofundus erugo]
MSERGITRLAVSFDGSGWYAADPLGNTMPLPVSDGCWLPDLPDGASCEQLLLPVEQLLVRVFSLPLTSPRLIDAGILGQELDDRAAIDIDAWWLGWLAASGVQQAESLSPRVAGIVFGLPISWKEEIDASPAWQQVRVVAADAALRLGRHLNPKSEHDSQSWEAVFDADQDGFFFGLWRGDACYGMRRVNRSGAYAGYLAEEVTRSLQAMAATEAMVCHFSGLLDEPLLHALRLPSWHGRTESEGDLPTRHQANLASATISSDASLSAATRMNFRHGRWAASKGIAWIRPWYRALSLAGMLLLLWLAGLGYQIHSLNTNLAATQQQIVQAFHQGLPDEKVMIDALAQLRRAAGSSGEVSPLTARWLQQVAAVHQVYKATSWQMGELEWQDGVMKMSGKAANLQLLNVIRQSLQKQTGRDVKLLDTDLSGQQVTFRMQWQ